MKKTIVAILFFVFFINAKSQDKYILIIDSIQNVFNNDVSFPYWLNENQTVRPGPNVKSISIIEFKVDTAANNNLVFQKVITLKSWGKVPVGKVWKIESIGVSADLFAGPVIFTSPKLFKEPGTYTWIVPPGVTNITVEVWGGGGNGGAGYGGGGGGYGMQSFQVSPGSSYIVTVGGTGDTSSFSNLISALPGQDGTVSGPGAGGTATSSFKINGDKGGYSFLPCQSQNGGNGGNGGTGGRPTIGFSIPCFIAQHGNAPGGGGSAASAGGVNNTGVGLGAPGQVIIHW